MKPYPVIAAALLAGTLAAAPAQAVDVNAYAARCTPLQALPIDGRGIWTAYVLNSANGVTQALALGTEQMRPLVSMSGRIVFQDMLNAPPLTDRLERVRGRGEIGGLDAESQCGDAMREIRAEHISKYLSLFTDYVKGNAPADDVRLSIRAKPPIWHARADFDLRVLTGEGKFYLSGKMDDPSRIEIAFRSGSDVLIITNLEGTPEDIASVTGPLHSLVDVGALRKMVEDLLGAKPLEERARTMRELDNPTLEFIIKEGRVDTIRELAQ